MGEDGVQSFMLPFANVTERAALAAFPWIGKGNKNNADAASTTVMRQLLNELDIDAHIVIGEGEMDEAPMLYIGEKVGTGKGLALDIAVDPIDGTTQIAKGQGNSITVLAVAPYGGLLNAPDMYMQKIAVGPEGKGLIDLEAPLIDNMKAIASAKAKRISDLNIMVQDRPRHADIIREIQSLGASATVFNDVDVTAAISTCLNDKRIDMFVGTGGAPEGVLAAAGVKSLGGDFQARLLPQNERETERCVQMGITDLDKILEIDDLVRTSDCFFVATGITEGFLLNGIRTLQENRYVTHSFLACAGGTYHFLKTVHQQ